MLKSRASETTPTPVNMRNFACAIETEIEGVVTLQVGRPGSTLMEENTNERHLKFSCPGRTPLASIADKVPPRLIVPVFTSWIVPG
ncbi:hypothetical protein D3C81_2019300 [compost metagenome]